MTSHELAKKLLEQPDEEVFVEMASLIEQVVDVVNNGIIKIIVDVDDGWNDPEIET
jgi:hypothetical protein